MSSKLSSESQSFPLGENPLRMSIVSGQTVDLYLYLIQRYTSGSQSKPRITRSGSLMRRRWVHFRW